jgi:hypothetical protein
MGKKVSNNTVKENIKEDLAEKVMSDTTKTDVVNFPYAHLCLKCSCGSNYIIDKDIKGGLRIELPTNDTAAIKLACRDCGHEMELYYRKSDKKDEVDTETITTEETK